MEVPRVGSDGFFRVLQHFKIELETMQDIATAGLTPIAVKDLIRAALYLRYQALGSESNAIDELMYERAAVVSANQLIAAVELHTPHAPATNIYSSSFS